MSTKTYLKFCKQDPPQSLSINTCLSVDWLNNAVYISVQTPGPRHNSSIAQQQPGYWTFVFCDLSLDNCHQLNLNVNSKPRYLKADPFHGYLYWVERVGEEDKLYRANLETPSSGSVLCSLNQRNVLYSAPRLGQPVVSFTQYSVLIPDQTSNQVCAYYQILLSTIINILYFGLDDASVFG